MDKMGCAQVPPVVRKEKKKKNAKDGLDRLKQAEKKKRRLEKALANSAAIRSELEKKREKKKEEQKRLDEEGAAIAEAVALHVLLGEDSDDSCKIVLKNEEGLNPWNCVSNIGIFREGFKDGIPLQGLTYACDCKWNNWELRGWSLSPCVCGKDLHDHGPYFEDIAGTIAAQAVSSLHIAEDACEDAIVINGMLDGEYE